MSLRPPLATYVEDGLLPPEPEGKVGLEGAELDGEGE